MKNVVPVHLGSLDNMKAWLGELVAKERPDLAAPVDTSTPFIDLGLDSMSAVTLTGTIEMALNIELPATLIWDYPDIDALAEFLVQTIREPATHACTGPRSLAA